MDLVLPRTVKRRYQRDHLIKRYFGLMRFRMVGSLGVEPSMPEASDLQSGAVASAARYPWNYGGCELNTTLWHGCLPSLRFSDFQYATFTSHHIETHSVS